METILCDRHRLLTGGSASAALSLSNNWPKPGKKPGEDELLIRVLACSLTPVDVQVLLGYETLFEENMHYIPGGHTCGVVEESDEKSNFKVGDVVIAKSGSPIPCGGLAEYAVVKSSMTEMMPTCISPLEASCLPGCGAIAILAARRYVKRGSRVLIVGGNGGVGAFFSQLARHSGASFIAATSPQKETIHGFGADLVLEDNEQAMSWWDSRELKKNPFDLIFDLIGGNQIWTKAKTSGVLKKRGIFLSALGDDLQQVIEGRWDFVKLQVNRWWREVWTTLWPMVPRYKYHIRLKITASTIAELVQLVKEGHVSVVLDPSCPLPFTTEGVKHAFHMQMSGLARGNVVIQIAGNISALAME